jgi:hypothetical protein
MVLWIAPAERQRRRRSFMRPQPRAMRPRQSGVALRLPPQSKALRRIHKERDGRDPRWLFSGFLTAWSTQREQSLVQ